MMTYFGFGFPADSTRHVHESRKNGCLSLIKPFTPDSYNKCCGDICYMLSGLYNLVKWTFCRCCCYKSLDLNHCIGMEINGAKVPISTSDKSITGMSVPSICAGRDWLDVEGGKLALGKSDNIARIFCGVSGCLRKAEACFNVKSHDALPQANATVIKIKHKLAIHIDGEAWLQQPGTLTIHAEDWWPILKGHLNHPRDKMLAREPAAVPL